MTERASALRRYSKQHGRAERDRRKERESDSDSASDSDTACKGFERVSYYPAVPTAKAMVTRRTLPYKLLSGKRNLSR